MPQEFSVALPGQAVGQTVAGLVQADMLPDVSARIMKYGFAGAGHWDMSGDRHAAGSAAESMGDKVTTPAASEVRSKAPRVRGDFQECLNM